MAQEICGKTKVTINGNSTVCSNFPEIWELLKDTVRFTEQSKSDLIRVLFINGYVDLKEYGADVQFEIVWEE